MDEREFKRKLANALKNNNSDEICYFLAYLQGYLDSEQDGKFKKLMLNAMENTEIEKSFNV